MFSPHISKSIRDHVLDKIEVSYDVSFLFLNRRQSQQSTRTYEISDNLAIPQWKSFIANDSNKAALQNYLAVSWEKHMKELPRGFQLIVGGLASDLGKTLLLTAAGSSEIPDLSCTDHEEADTRIFAHISYCVNQYVIPVYVVSLKVQLLVLCCSSCTLPLSVLLSHHFPLTITFMRMTRNFSSLSILLF